MVLGIAKRWRARRLGEAILRSLPDSPEPTFPGLVTQLCTANQTRVPEYLAWCDVLKRRPDAQRRKVWEYCYILQGLQEQLGLRSGLRGLGFGVGTEQLPAVFAARGIDVVATDQGLSHASRRGWTKTRQHATSTDNLQHLKLCDCETLEKHVTFRVADMNAINEDLRGFDFVWSTCAFEHLGSIENGKRFVLNAMDCVRPGGVALHTTEFNLASNGRTVDHAGTVLFRRRDIDDLIARLASRGHEALPFNSHPGSELLDHHVDVPPYRWTPHLRLLLEGYAATSIGIIIKRSA